jgi:hypothetical protein
VLVVSRAVAACGSFDFGQLATDRAGHCWHERTTDPSCPEGFHPNAYDYYRLRRALPPAPPAWPAPPAPPEAAAAAAATYSYVQGEPAHGEPTHGADRNASSAAAALSYDSGGGGSYDADGGESYDGADEASYDGADGGTAPAAFSYESSGRGGPLAPAPAVDARFVRLRAGAECADGADTPLGVYDAVQACANACSAAVACHFFLYGFNRKRGECWAEWTVDGCATEAWDEPDDFDFYALLPPRAPDPPPSPPSPPSAPGVPPPSPPPLRPPPRPLPMPAPPPIPLPSPHPPPLRPAPFGPPSPPPPCVPPPSPPSAPPQALLDALRERAVSLGAFVSGSLAGGGLVGALACVGCLTLYCGRRALRRPRSEETQELASARDWSRSDRW